MPRNSLSFPVRVSREIHLICFFHFLAQICQYLSFPPYCNVLRLIIMLNVNAQLALGQIPDMPVGCGNHIITSQKFFNCLHLCRRLHDYKIACHITASSIKNDLPVFHRILI